MSEEKLTRAAIVTGGSRGIGRAVCVALAKQGCNVVVNYCHGAESAEQTAALCRAEGVQAVTVQADVSTAEGCKALFDAAAEAFGRVDVLVNNAGITRDNLILRLTEQDFDAVLDTNLKSAFLCCKEAARRMVRQRYGRIVNLSSVVALRGNAGQTNYAASKAGLIGLTKSLARELAARNVTVNAVAPGFIDTDMTAVLPEAVRTGMTQGIPAGRAGQPEDVAQAVAFFAAEQSLSLIHISDAGGHLQPDADGKDLCRHRAVLRPGRVVHQRADPPHHRRRDCQLCQPWRYYAGRARGADRLCGSPGH